MADESKRWDPSNYVLGSLAAAVFLLALAGATNTTIWVLVGIAWVGIAATLHTMERG